MEYSRIKNSHIIDFGELLVIGRVVVHDLINDEEHEYNISYISTAIRWAIRNELRRRYKWYVAKSKENKSEHVYMSILSINELQEQENPVQIVDHSITPAQKCELDDLKIIIGKSVKKLPERERNIIESRFFKEKSVREISMEFCVSPSRISRIIQSGIEKIKLDLKKQEVLY